MPTEPVSIAQTIVYGVVFDPKNSERVSTMDLNELFASVGRLFDLLEERGVDYVLVGGIAMLSYIEGRNTQDIDLLIAEKDLPRLPELRIDERNERFARAWLSDLRVDILFSENEPFKTVSKRYVGRRQYVDRSVPCATETGMLLMKLFALPSLYRQGRFDRVDVYRGDLTGLLRRGVEPSEAMWGHLTKVMLESDVTELKRVVADLQRQIADGGKPFAS